MVFRKYTDTDVKDATIIANVYAYCAREKFFLKLRGRNLFIELQQKDANILYSELKLPDLKIADNKQIDRERRVNGFHYLLKINGR